MYRTTTTRVIAVLAIAAAGLTACGDDDDSTASGTPGTANPDYAAFCAAELAVEEATSGDDVSAIEPAFAALLEVTPDSSKDIVTKTIEEARKFLGTDQPPTDAFNEQYAKLMGVMQDECGFQQMAVTTKDYEFTSLTDGLKAGGTVIAQTNDGTEYHEVSIFRKNDGVDMTAKDILALGEEESMTKATQMGGSFAAPGTTAYGVTQLTAGSYFVACFIPQGFTQEAYDAMMTGGAEPDGEPHFMLGMVKEFEVK